MAKRSDKLRQPKRYQGVVLEGHGDRSHDDQPLLFTDGVCNSRKCIAVYLMGEASVAVRMRR